MWKLLLLDVRSGMMFFGERTSALVNAALLFFIYAIGVGSMSILARLVGKKFLELHTDESRETYWGVLDEESKDVWRYYRQF